MNILIYYPDLFNAKTKFNRKLDNILQNVDGANILFQSDLNNLISDYFSCKDNFNLIQIDDIFKSNISHAIVFYEENIFFQELNNFIIQNNIASRYIKVKITKVVNIDKETQYKGLKSTKDYEYIGRGSYWGNPYSMYDFSDGEEITREDVIEKFKYDFDFDKFINKDKRKVYDLAGKTLGCFCKPLACHGDVLADFLNSWDDGE